MRAHDGVRNGRHSGTWWTALSAVATVIGVVIAYIAWLHPRSPDATVPPVQPTSGSSTSFPDSSRSTGPSGARDATGGTVSASGKVYLSDVAKNNFIRQPSNVTRGPATMSNEEYASSYSFAFSGCGGECTYDVELNLPGAYSRFTGVVGLTDRSRHDNAVDGIVHFAVYSQVGDLLHGPQKVEFPERVPFDIDVAGVTRVRLSVAKGTNGEYPCWCNAQFSK